jgi:hypothetical protein
MPHVFISYVRENGNLVDRLASELKSRGVTVWLDRNDIEPGARWRDAIKNAIRDGKFFWPASLGNSTSVIEVI